MTEYEKLIRAEELYGEAEIIEAATGREGMAQISPRAYPNIVGVWYGAGDGSDDKNIKPEEFNSQFIVTSKV